MTRSQVGSSALVVALIVFQAMLAAAIASPDSADTLGISQRVIAWAAIANVGVGVLLNQLRTLGDNGGEGGKGGDGGRAGNGAGGVGGSGGVGGTGH